MILIMILIQKYQTRIMIKIMIRIDNFQNHQSREAHTRQPNRYSPIMTRKTFAGGVTAPALQNAKLPFFKHFTVAEVRDLGQFWQKHIMFFLRLTRMRECGRVPLQVMIVLDH